MTRVLILAGGYGARMGDLTKDLPKPLLRIGNKTVLHHIIDRLNLHGLSQIIINTHYLPVHINEALETRALFYHVPRLLGHKDTIYALKDWLKEDWFFTLNGDTLSNCNFSEMLNLKEPDKILALMDENRCAGVWLYPPTYFKKSDLSIKPYRPYDLVWHDIGNPTRLEIARKYYEGENNA